MEKANLYCPQERVFFNNLLVYVPVLPGQNKTKRNQKPSKIEVDVLGVFGERALIRLPNLMATPDRETALVGIQYLS